MLSTCEPSSIATPLRSSELALKNSTHLRQGENISSRLRSLDFERSMRIVSNDCASIQGVSVSTILIGPLLMLATAWRALLETTQSFSDSSKILVQAANSGLRPDEYRIASWLKSIP